MNKYLQKKLTESSQNDYRNPYGSNDSRRGRRGRDMGDYRNDYAEYDSGYDSRYDNRSNNNDYHFYNQQRGEYPRHMDYESYSYGKITPMHRDYGYPLDYNSMEQEYKHKLKEWIDKLKIKDRFGHPMEKIIQQAKNMGVKFEGYNELEFYAIYLAMVSDYKTIANDYNMYIKMAKDFLEDDDIAVTPSEKVCIYLYEIVLGDK